MARNVLILLTIVENILFNGKSNVRQQVGFWHGHQNLSKDNALVTEKLLTRAERLPKFASVLGPHHKRKL